ncbi:MAG: hypothetical protein Q8N15_01035 [Bacillota bacterium]|nr:hypothetical protein [Bacillota bacterium]
MPRPDQGEGKLNPFLRLRGLSAIVALSLVFGGCGIEEYILLDKPEKVEMYDTRTVLFKHSAANSDSDVFTGYDVYYRLFDEESKAIAVSGVDDQLEATSPDVLVQRLKAAKYQSIIGIESDGTAIVFGVFNPLTNTSSTDVTFRFTLDSDGLVYVNNQVSNIVVRRSAYDSTPREYRNFSDFTSQNTPQDSQTTADCAYLSSTPSTVWFRGYIVATGIDMTKQFKQYYSVPVLIGGGITKLP